MAQRVDKMPPVHRGAPSIYPWEEWFDGSVWELIPGEDFTITTSSMRALIERSAGRRHLHVDLSQTGNRLYVQVQR